MKWDPDKNMAEEMKEVFATGFVRRSRSKSEEHGWSDWYFSTGAGSGYGGPHMYTTKKKALGKYPEGFTPQHQERHYVVLAKEVEIIEVELVRK